MRDQLLSRIQDRSARIGIIGQGYVGLPLALVFREAPLRQVFEVISRSAGINFILDREIRPDSKVTIFVRDVRVEDALDLIVSTNQLAKKVLDEREKIAKGSAPPSRSSSSASTSSTRTTRSARASTRSTCATPTR